MAFGPSGQLGYALEAGLLVQAGGLEVVRRNPYPQRAARGGLRDEGIEQLPAMAEAATGFVDPHQFEFGDPRPGIAGGNADRVSGLAPQREDEVVVVAPAGEAPVIAVEAFLN